jgi:hypothetical protein
MAIREWLRMQEPEFCCNRIFKPVPRWDRLGNLLIEQLSYFLPVCYILVLKFMVKFLGVVSNYLGATYHIESEGEIELVS